MQVTTQKLLVVISGLFTHTALTLVDNFFGSITDEQVQLLVLGEESAANSFINNHSDTLVAKLASLVITAAFVN